MAASGMGFATAYGRRGEAENKGVEEANKDMEVAISIPGSNFERKLKDKKFLYSDLSEKQLKKFIGF